MHSQVSSSGRKHFLAQFEVVAFSPGERLGSWHTASFRPLPPRSQMSCNPHFPCLFGLGCVLVLNAQFIFLFFLNIKKNAACTSYLSPYFVVTLNLDKDMGELYIYIYILLSF